MPSRDDTVLPGMVGSMLKWVELRLVFFFAARAVFLLPEERILHMYLLAEREQTDAPALGLPWKFCSISRELEMYT